MTLTWSKNVNYRSHLPCLFSHSVTADFVRFACETVYKNNLQYWNLIHPCRLHWLHWVCWGWSNCRISSYICTELCQIVNNTLEKKSNLPLSIQQIILIWQIQIGHSHGIPRLCPAPCLAFSLLNCRDEVKTSVREEVIINVESSK